MRLALVAVLLVLVACGEQAPRQVEITGLTMGTQFSVKLPRGPGEHDPVTLQKQIEDVLGEDEAEMSTYLLESDISRFNINRTVDWQPVTKSFCDRVEASLALSAQTDGAFDITVAPLVNLWGFGPSGLIDEPPSDEQIAEAQGRTGHDRLHTDCAVPAVKKDVAELMIDLSAIGKGFAADRVAELLTSLGFDSYMVEIGGELRIRGTNAGQAPWAIGIEVPLPNVREPHTIVHLTNTAMATSGDYRNFFEADGQLYSHTIDTRTGRPVSHTLASVTVVDEHGWRADALATALLVMGPEEGMAFAEREDLAILMLLREGDAIKEQQTAAFARLRQIS